MEDELTPMEKKDPYISQIAFTTVGEAKSRETKGQLVAVSGRTSDNRGLILIPQQTRVLCKNEIHELMNTDEAGAGPNKTVDRIGVIGFFEVSQGGSVAVGDPMFVAGKEIGEVAGFDETHFPNHYNVVVLTSRRYSSLEAGFQIGDKLRIGNRSRKTTP